MTMLTGKVARILFAIPFIMFGIFHFTSASDMAGMLAGWPMAEIMVYISGAGLLAGGIAIILDKKTRLACLLLALLMLIIVLAIHVPGLSNPDTMMMSMSMMLKDIGLIGGALILAGISGTE